MDTTRRTRTLIDPDRPTDYCIGYEDDQLWQQALVLADGDPDATDPTDYYRLEDAKTRTVAFKLARRRAGEQRSTVSVYIRPNLVCESDGIWTWDTKICIATVEPDGSVERYEK